MRKLSWLKLFNIYLFIILFISGNVFAETTEPSSTMALDRASLHFGYSSLSSRVTGSGFNFSQNNAAGSVSSIQFQAKSKKMALTLIGGYSLQQNKFETPASLSPTEMHVRKEEFHIYGLTLPTLGSSWFAFQMGLGYKYQKFTADQSTPNSAMTSLTSQGMLIALKKEIAPVLESAPALDLDLQLYLPHRIHEKSVSTGYNPNAWGLQAKITWRKPLNEKTQLLISPLYSYDVVTFTGSGTRGTKSATDARTYFNLPIGIEHLF